MKKRALIFALAVLPVLTAVGVAVASSAFDGAKSATAAFHDIDKAMEAGYTVKVADLAGIECIADPGGSGAMGVHMLNPALLFDDGVIDADQPEVLVYELRNDRTMRTGRVLPSRHCSGRSSTRSRRATATGCRCSTRCTRGSGSRIRTGS
jgi:hypothetical protein